MPKETVRAPGAGPEAPTTLLGASTQGSRRMLWLSVSEDGRAWSLPLPGSGQITIGRAAENDVVLRGPLVSRVHAILHVGNGLEVEDARSANGTSVRQTGIAPGARVDVACGDPILIGSAALVIHGRGLSPARLDKQVTVEQLGQRVTALGQERGGATVARLRLKSELHAQWVTALLCEALPGGASVAWLARGACGVVVGAPTADEGTAAVRAVTDSLATWGVIVAVELRHVPWPSTCERVTAALGLLGAGAASKPEERAGALVRDPAMQKLYGLVDRVAVGTISVIVLGETGVGKEVVARAIHAASPRRDQPLVAINCAAMSETLIESELFGFEAGSFTGARASKVGLIESAHKGTLLLDEVGELPLATQVKLLRVLETKEVLRIGGVSPRAIDVRIIAATNRDLSAAVARGVFREDLLFRLNGVALHVPPLRERRTEIEPLALRFVAALSSQLGRPVPRIDDGTLARLEQHRWPGNVRELRNVMERAVLLCADDAILPEDLPADVCAGTPAPATLLDQALAAPVAATASAALEDDERERIVAALDACAGNQTRAAEFLKMPRRTLVKRLRQYAIPRPRTRPDGGSP